MKALLTATLVLLFSSAALCQSARDVTASLPASFTNILKEREYTGSYSISEWQFQKLNNNTNASPFLADGQVDSGDEVSVSFSGFYADADGNPSSDVATTTQLLLSLSLSGDDADKYFLTNPSVSIPASITPQDLKSSDQSESVAFRKAFENFKLIDSEINVSTKIIESSLGYYPLRSDSVAIYQSPEGFTVYATKGKVSKPTEVGSGREIILVLTLVGNDNYKLSVSQLSYCSNCGSVVLPYFDIHVSPDTIVDYGTTISVAVKGSNSYAISGFINYDPQTGSGTGLIKAQQKAPLPVGTHVVTGVATGSGHSKTVKSFNVTVLPISLSINGQLSIASRPYDATANLGKVTLPTLDGSNLIKSDTASLFFSVDSSAVRPSVGTYQVLFLAHLSNPNYSLTDSVFSVPFSITPSEVPSVSLSGNELPSTSKVYDGTTDLPLSSDSIPIPNTHAHITAARFSSPKAGSQSIVVDVAADANYTLQGGFSSLSNVSYPTKGTISQRPVTPNADAVVASRVYDATTAIERRSVTPPTLNNVVPTDSVSAMVVSAEVDNPAPGLRTATISLALVGPDAANYTLGDNTSVTAPVTITQLDKTPVRFVLRGSLPLTYGNSTIGAIPDADIFVDTDPIVSGSLSVNSHDRGIALPAGDNLVRLVFTPQDTIVYAIADSTISISVNPVTLSLVGSFSANGKVYDGTPSVTDTSIVLPSISGVLNDDDVLLNVDSVSFASKNAGDNVITAYISLTGPDANNYSLPTSTLSCQAAISPKQLSVSSPQFSSTSKVYDGTTSAPDFSTPPSLIGVLDGDDVSLSSSAAFDSPDAGQRTITTTLSLTGPDANNYSLPTDTSYPTKGTISQRPVTPNADAVVASRVYDATTAIERRSVTPPTLNNVVPTDSVSAMVVSAEVDNPAPGLRTATISLALVGPDAANYTLGDNTSVTAPVTITQLDKTPVRFVLRGSLPLTYGNSTIGAIPDADIFVDTDPIVSGSLSVNSHDRGIALPAGDNLVRLVFTPQDTIVYAIADSTISISVNPVTLSLVGSFSANGKVYDGTSSVTDTSIVLPSISGILDGDDVRLNVDSVSFASKNAGDNVITAYLSLTGSDANNYTLPTSSLSCQAAISPKQLSISSPQFSSTSKVYDGTTSAPEFSTPPFLIGVVDGDDVSLSSSAAFDSPDAGQRTITTSLSLTGPDADNYSLPSSTLSCQAAISPKQLSVSSPQFSSTSKVYDGTTSAPDFSTTPSLIGVVEGDDVSLSSSAAFDSPDAGSRTITTTLSLTGSDANNYTLPTTSLSCQAAISPKQLSISSPQFSSTSKVYDGTTSAPEFSTPPSLIGVVDGDAVSLSSSAAFDSPDAGPRTIVVSFSLFGSDANNYLAPDAYSVAGEISEPSPTPDPTPTPDPIAATATILSAADYGYCATDTIVIALNVSSGAPTSYSLTFTDALFPNVTDAAIPDDFVLLIPVSSSDGFGSSNASLVLHDADNNVSSPAIAITLLRRPDASRLGVKFGNTLFVNNFDNAFSAYQWTADGVDIPGASNQFYFSHSLSPAAYACRLTTSSGDVLLSCPLTINSPSSSTTLSVAPNPVRSGESLSIRFGDADTTLSVELYNTFGALCESHSIPNGGSFPVSSPQGAYVVSVSSSNATAKVKITIK